MTNLERSENARILLSHSTIKPEFVQYSGQFISDLCDQVFKHIPINHDDLPMGAVKGETKSHDLDGSHPFTAVRIEPNSDATWKAQVEAWNAACDEADEADKYMPGLCPRCFNYREISINMPNGDYQIVDCLECAL